MSMPRIGATEFQSALDNQALSKVRASTSTGDSARIEKSAKEFESLLLSHWLQEAQQSFASVPGGSDNGDNDESADPGRSQFQSLGIQALAQEMSKSGGIGIAKMICHQLERHLQDSSASTNQPVENK